MERDLTRVWAENAARRWQKDFDDLQNENAGRNVGRITRFTGNAGGTLLQGQEQARELFAMEWLGRQTASYKEAYFGLMDTIGDVRRELDELGEKLAAQENEARVRIEEMESRTITLPDGRKVFLNEVGDLVDDTGMRLNDKDQEWVKQQSEEKRRNIQKYETWKQNKEHLERIQAEQERMQRYRDELARLEERAKRGELSEDELKEAKQKLEEDMNGQRLRVQGIEQESLELAAQKEAIATLGERRLKGEITDQQHQQGVEAVRSEMSDKNLQAMDTKKQDFLEAFGDEEELELPSRTASYSGQAIEGESLKPQFIQAALGNTATAEEPKNDQMLENKLATVKVNGPTPS